MAARFWSYVLGWHVALAIAIAWIWSRLTSAAAWAFATAAVFVALLLLVGELGTSFVVTRVGAGSAAPMKTTVARMCRALLSELLFFGAAWMAMVAAPFKSDRVRARAASRGLTCDGAPVLLIHGFTCNAAIWQPVRRRLEASGITHIRALNLEPIWTDLDSYLPEVLSELRGLEREAGGQPVTLVAHSIGGLVARALVRAEPRRIRQLITLGTPHHGTVLAGLIARPPLPQLRPDSLWLRALNAAQEGNFPVPLTCIYSLDDNIVAPADSAVLRGAQLLTLEGLGHFGLLHSRLALDLIAASLKRAQATPLRVS